MVDSLIRSIKSSFSKIVDHRYKNAQIALSDFLQSAFAMFHLKDPSLHHYRINYPEREANLERIYDIKSLHSDAAAPLTGPSSTARPKRTFGKRCAKYLICCLVYQRTLFTDSSQKRSRSISLSSNEPFYFFSNSENRR